MFRLSEGVLDTHLFPSITLKFRNVRYNIDVIDNDRLQVYRYKQVGKGEEITLVTIRLDNAGK